MIAVTATIQELHETFATVSVTVTNVNAGYQQLFFHIYLDRITLAATVTHQNHIAHTAHMLDFDCIPADIEAFAICATLSLMFNMKA